MEKKMPKKDMFTLISELCSEYPDVVEFCESELTILANKAEKAKARAAEKKAAGDELYAAVLGCVGSDLMNAELVLDMLSDYADITIAKVRSRLSQGVRNGVLVKETIKDENSKPRVFYKKA